MEFAKQKDQKKPEKQDGISLNFVKNVFYSSYTWILCHFKFIMKTISKRVVSLEKYFPASLLIFFFMQLLQINSFATSPLPSCKKELGDYKIKELKNLIKKHSGFQNFIQQDFLSENYKPKVEIQNCLDNSPDDTVTGHIINKTYLENHENLNFSEISCSINGETWFSFVITLKNNQILYKPLIKSGDREILPGNFTKNFLTDTFEKALKHPFLRNIKSVFSCQIQYRYLPNEKTFTISLNGISTVVRDSESHRYRSYDFDSKSVFNSSGNLKYLQLNGNNINQFLKKNDNPLIRLYLLFLEQKENQLRECEIEASGHRHRVNVFIENEKNYKASVSFRCTDSRNCDSTHTLTTSFKGGNLQEPKWSISPVFSGKCKK